MKLLNILARELKAWPKTNFLAQDRNGHVFGWSSEPRWSIDQWVMQKKQSIDICRPGKFSLSVDFSSAIVTCAEWQAAVDALNADKCEHSYANNIGCPECGELNAPKVVEWEQGNIPNAGDQCEAYVLAETEKQGRPMNRWIPGKFIGKALADNGGIALLVECDDGWTHVINAFSYVRPVRTPEQVAAEERESGIQAIQDAYTYTVGPSTHKILHSQATRLYDAGCRLQVTP